MTMTCRLDNFVGPSSTPGNAIVVIVVDIYSNQSRIATETFCEVVVRGGDMSIIN
jgi:hypothetical protein